MVKGERPEFTAPPDIFYNDTEARKYTTSSRMENIQASPHTGRLLPQTPGSEQLSELWQLQIGSSDSASAGAAGAA